MTDYKQLCAELIDALDSGIPSARIRSSPLADQARAALTEPEPEGLTDEELLCIAAEAIDGYGNCGIKPGEYTANFLIGLGGRLRRLTRGGNIGINQLVLNEGRTIRSNGNCGPCQLNFAQPLAPVPVSERLPEPEDCNDEGEVWAWRRFDFEGCMDNGDFWCLAYHEWLEDEDCGFTHWLPAHALPLPTHD